jgi:hypothetical protein
MPIGYCVRLAASALACLLSAAPLAAAAQDAVEQFYRGKQISVIVGSSSGGGYDTYARCWRAISLRGCRQPRRWCRNMSGAGSKRAAGYIYSVAPKDGTAAAAIFPARCCNRCLRVPVSHDPNKSSIRQRQQRRLCSLRAQRRRRCKPTRTC